MTLGATFVNASTGIIVAGKGSDTTKCTDGIIVAGRDGIIVAGRGLTGLIVGGIMGIIVAGAPDTQPCTDTTPDGIIVAG